MSKPFKFKQFEIYQDKTAMKVGTDSILLGCWVNPENCRTILDIGAGTGILSLMMAQRFNNANIVAVEIEENAFKQAKININSSGWNNKIEIIHNSIQHFKANYKFDLIISNPPYYINSYEIKDDKRAMARTTNELSYSELLSFASKYLSSSGILALIIPYSNEEIFLKIAHSFDLFPNKITRVKGNLKAKIKRSLIQLSCKNITNSESELIIQKENNCYTDEFIRLTQDFYLNM